MLVLWLHHRHKAGAFLCDSHLLTARWKYSDTVAAEPFKLMVFLLLTAVAAMVAAGVGKG